MNFVRVVVLFFISPIIQGLRQNGNNSLEDILEASIAEHLHGELDFNEFADLNTKAFIDANAALGVCNTGNSLPPSCCCVPSYTESECRGLGETFFYYPRMQPYDKGARDTRTCHKENLCCHHSASGKCATKMDVTIVKGDNNEKKSKTYVKLEAGTYAIKTDPYGGKDESKWNKQATFDAISDIDIEVKWKKFGGAGSYGTFKVHPKFWSKSTETVEVAVPKFGTVTLQITLRHPQYNIPNFEVDDDYDSGLCSVSKSSALLQRTDAPGLDDIDAFLAELEAETGEKQEKAMENEPVFLNVLNHRPNQVAPGSKFMTRDYTLIIDRSGSMSRKDTVHVPSKMAELLDETVGSHSLTRWKQVDGALQYLAPYVVAEDPDGVGVYFFDSKFDKAENVCDRDKVINLFKQNRPGGRTYLAEVLAEAMEPDTIGRAETIFVLTDGEASDPEAVTRAIVAHTKKMCKSEMLSISFIQVGSDTGASEYLNRLDDNLENEGAKFDIVDAMTKDEMEGKSFLDVVELSVHD